MSNIEDLIREALVYEADAFNSDSDVNAADMVDFFAEWRINMASALETVGVKGSCGCGAAYSQIRGLPHRDDCHTVKPKMMLRADALAEARKLGKLIADAPIPEHVNVTRNVKRFADLVMALIGEPS